MITFFLVVGAVLGIGAFILFLDLFIIRMFEKYEKPRWYDRFL